MNKSVILNCKNYKKCNLNDKGDCKLSHVSFSSVDSTNPDRLICEDFEPIPESQLQKARDGEKDLHKM